MNSETIINNLYATHFTDGIKFRVYYGADMMDSQIVANAQHPVIAFRMKDTKDGPGCNESDILDFIATSLESRMLSETDNRQKKILADAIESLFETITTLHGYREP